MLAASDSGERAGAEAEAGAGGLEQGLKLVLELMPMLVVGRGK